MPKVAATVPLPVISDYEKLFSGCESIAKLVRLDAENKKRGIDFARSETEWAKIEASYGHKLPADVRKPICDLTLTFLFFVRTEDAATHVSYARKQIEKIKRTAEESGIGLEQVMAPIIAYCAAMLVKLADPEKHGPRKGEMWNAWVRLVGAALKEQALPTEVRKDETNAEKVSPFVKLIRELQQTVPREYRKGDHSTVALAAAIVRARSVHRRVAKGPRKPA